MYRSLLLVLGADRKIPITTIIFGFQSRYAGNFRERHSSFNFFCRHLWETTYQKSVREESSVSNGLTDQWTDDIDLIGYYKEIYTGLSQKNRSEYGRNPSGIATPTANIIY